ncbi:MAG: glycosyltransferase family 4 protein [Patescibacteria group bacterium]|nr:glycosyltransferase family 4 protein [Patescibacteria group bacterium]
MNILFTTSTLPLSKNDSILSIVLDLAVKLEQHTNNKIIVLAPHYPGAETEEIINNIKIYRFRYFLSRLQTLCYGYGITNNLKKNKLNYLLLPFFFIFQILAIKKIVKKEKIDLLHTHWLVPQGLTAVIYKKLFNKKLPLVCTLHGTDVFGLQSKIFKIIKKHILNNINAITAISQSVKNQINKINKNANKLSIIHHGIDTNIFKPNINTEQLKAKYQINSFCLFTAGRLAISKGYLYIVEAMPKIISIHPNAKLLIAGQGPDKNKIKVKIKKLNLEKNIILLGSVSRREMPNYYALADIFIGASLNIPGQSAEGFGLVYLEAMACSTPIIATAVGGATELVSKETGILIPDKNKTAIEKAIIALLSRPNKLKSLKNNCLKRVNNKFGWKNIAQQYNTIYQTLK